MNGSVKRVIDMHDVDVMVLYDIGDDHRRMRLIEHLEYLGLHRIQFSVFKGAVPKRRISRIVAGCRAICTDREDRLMVVPLCRSCVRRVVSIHSDLEEHDPDGYVV